MRIKSIQDKQINAVQKCIIKINNQIMYDIGLVNLYKDTQSSHQTNDSSKMYFRPIHKHSSFPSIKSILQKLTQNSITLDQIIAALCLFKYISEEQAQAQSYLKNGLKLVPFSIVKKIFSFKKSYEDNKVLERIIKGTQKYSERYQQLRAYHCKQYVKQLFQKIARFILDIKQQEAQYIPILLSNYTGLQTLSEKQILYILCLMALNLVPKQQYHKDQYLNKNFNYRNNTFSFIFNNNQFKTRNILEYLKLKLIPQGFLNNLPVLNHFTKDKHQKLFQIKRQCVNESIKQLMQRKRHHTLCQYHLYQDKQSIEQHFGQAKVDFANKYIGGGALSKGCVQQQIMYANHPQLFVTILLCQSLKDNESLLYKGFKKYFESSGYSYSTKYGYMEKIRSEQEYIVAIDALDFSKEEYSQFIKSKIDRQIIKAYAGFNNTQGVQYIVTGNWGCGVFKGNLKLKFLIQWIAASLANKKVKYCPYGKFQQLSEALNYVKKSIEWPITSYSIKQVYDSLIQVSDHQYHSYDYDVLKEVFSCLKEKQMKKAEIHPLASDIKTNIKDSNQQDGKWWEQSQSQEIKDKLNEPYVAPDLLDLQQIISSPNTSETLIKKQSQQLLKVDEINDELLGIKLPQNEMTSQSDNQQPIQQIIDSEPNEKEIKQSLSQTIMMAELVNVFVNEINNNVIQSETQRNIQLQSQISNVNYRFQVGTKSIEFLDINHHLNKPEINNQKKKKQLIITSDQSKIIIQEQNQTNQKDSFNLSQKENYIKKRLQQVLI